MGGGFFPVVAAEIFDFRKWLKVLQSSHPKPFPRKFAKAEYFRGGEPSETFSERLKA